MAKKFSYSQADRAEIARRIAVLMDKRGYASNHTALAAAAGLSQPVVRAICLGETLEPKCTTMVGLSNTLGCSVAYLLLLSDRPISKGELTTEEAELIEGFSLFPPALRKSYLDTARSFALEAKPKGKAA